MTQRVSLSNHTEGWRQFTSPPPPPPANVLETQARVTLRVTSVLTMAIQYSQSTKNLPPVSYIKSLDIWMITCMVYVFMALLKFAIVYHVHYRRTQAPPPSPPLCPAATNAALHQNGAWEYNYGTTLGNTTTERRLAIRRRNNTWENNHRTMLGNTTTERHLGIRRRNNTWEYDDGTTLGNTTTERHLGIRRRNNTWEYDDGTTLGNTTTEQHLGIQRRNDTWEYDDGTTLGNTTTERRLGIQL
ncbi:hypothetical protein O3P69_011657 [Scylla paramamosain]|uniref:Neurotransmitter-gated ion-channel transmembrane domain-containing protein n=1 Tax=Scylla paramamosain TaxID=85552 RepID=A0AAW0T800_SCYPA